MHAFEGINELNKALGDIARYDQGKGPVIMDAKKAIGAPVMADLAYTSAFGTEEMKKMAREVIFGLADALNIQRKSTFNLYKAIGKGEVEGFTVPAINLRALAYNSAKAVFKAAKAVDARTIITEIARSEIGYTDQPPQEYAASVMAAAIFEGYEGPIFLQGDHFQTNRKRYFEDPDKEVQAIKDLIKQAIEAGFYNIDVDTSTLVEIEKPDLKAQQYLNSHVCAELTKYIRSIQPDDINVTVGGEIGEIGGKNSTEEDLIAFVDQFHELVGDMPGISKIAVQTGTAHGGVVLPDGTIAKVKVDFDVLERLGKLAREKYGIGGVVQHGASTLPEDMFDKFVEVRTLEIHLATQFQNIIYDLMPDELREEIYAYLEKEKRSEWKEGWTREQFLYKTRKRAIGPFKKAIWDMPQDVIDQIEEQLYEKFLRLFKLLGLEGTSEKVKPYI